MSPGDRSPRFCWCSPRHHSLFVGGRLETKNLSPDVEFAVLDEDDGVVSGHDSAVEHFSAFVCL